MGIDMTQVTPVGHPAPQDIAGIKRKFSKVDAESEKLSKISKRKAFHPEDEQHSTSQKRTKPELSHSRIGSEDASQAGSCEQEVPKRLKGSYC